MINNEVSTYDNYSITETKRSYDPMEESSYYISAVYEYIVPVSQENIYLMKSPVIRPQKWINTQEYIF